MHKFAKLLLTASLLSAPLLAAGNKEVEMVHGVPTYSGSFVNKAYPSNVIHIKSGEVTKLTESLDQASVADNTHSIVIVNNSNRAESKSQLWQVLRKKYSGTKLHRVIIKDTDNALDVKTYQNLTNQLTNINVLELIITGAVMSKSQYILQAFANTNNNKKLDFFHVKCKKYDFGFSEVGLLHLPEITNRDYAAIKEIIKLTNPDSIQMVSMNFGKIKGAQYFNTIAEGLSSSFGICKKPVALMLSSGLNKFGTEMLHLDGITFPNVKHLDIRGKSVDISNLSKYVNRFKGLQSLIMEFDEEASDADKFATEVAKILLTHKTTLKWFETNLNLAAAADFNSSAWLTLCKVVPDTNLEMFAVAKLNITNPAFEGFINKLPNSLKYVAETSEIGHITNSSVDDGLTILSYKEFKSKRRELFY